MVANWRMKWCICRCVIALCQVNLGCNLCVSESVIIDCSRCAVVNGLDSALDVDTLKRFPSVVKVSHDSKSRNRGRGFWAIEPVQSLPLIKPHSSTVRFGFIGMASQLTSAFAVFFCRSMLSGGINNSHGQIDCGNVFGEAARGHKVDARIFIFY